MRSSQADLLGSLSDFEIAAKWESFVPQSHASNYSTTSLPSDPPINKPLQLRWQPSCKDQRQPVAQHNAMYELRPCPAFGAWLWSHAGAYRATTPDELPIERATSSQALPELLAASLRSTWGPE